MSDKISNYDYSADATSKTSSTSGVDINIPEESKLIVCLKTIEKNIRVMYNKAESHDNNLYQAYYILGMISQQVATALKLAKE